MVAQGASTKTLSRPGFLAAVTNPRRSFIASFSVAISKYAGLPEPYFGVLHPDIFLDYLSTFAPLTSERSKRYPRFVVHFLKILVKIQFYAFQLQYHLFLGIPHA